MQVRVGSTDRALLRGLVPRTGGLLVVFFTLTVCKARSEEFGNRTNLHNHD